MIERATMEYFMDMHCHCLPGIDDGAKTMEESLQMLTQAYADGIRTIIATPHYHHRRGHAPKEVILRKVQEVQEVRHVQKAQLLHFYECLFYRKHRG